MEEKKTKRGNGRPPGGHGRVALQKKLAEVRREKEEQERLEAANVLSSLSSLVFTASKTPAENQSTSTDSNGDIDSSIPKTRPLTQSAAGIPSLLAPPGGLSSWASVPGGSGARSIPPEELQKLGDVKNTLILAQLQNKLNLMIQAQPSAPKPKQVDKPGGNHGVGAVPCSVAIRPRQNSSPKIRQSGPIVPSVVQTAESRKHHVSINPVQLLTVNKSVADALRARQGLKRQTSKDFEYQYAPEVKKQHIESELYQENATSEATGDSREPSPVAQVEKPANDYQSSNKKKDATDTNLPLKKRRLVSALKSPISSLLTDSSLKSSTLPSNRLVDLSSAAQIENILKMSRDYVAAPVPYCANSLITGVTAPTISDMNPQPVQGYRPIMIDPRTSLRVLSDVKIALTPDGDGDLPIHIAVVHENTELVKKFIDIMAMSGKSVDRYNKLQQTPLHLAVLVDKPDIVSALLSAHANPNLVDRNGHSSIHIAVNKQFHDCLFTVFQYTKYNCVMNGRNYEGYPPLHTCVELDDITAMEFLLQRGADVNIQDGKAGRSAIFYAAEFNRAAMVELLLQYGANTELPNYAGISAMMTAQAGNFVDIAHALQRVLDEQKLPEDLQYSRKIALNKIRKTPLIGVSDILAQSRSMPQDVKSAPVSRRSSSSSNHSPIDLSINRSTTPSFQESQFQYKQSNNGATEHKIKLERDRAATSSIIKEKHTQLIAALEGRQVTGNSNESNSKLVIPNGKLQPVAGIVTNGDKVINLTEENWRLLSNISEGQGSNPAIRIKEEPMEVPSASGWYSRPVNGNVELSSTSDCELPSEKSVQDTSTVVNSDDEEGCDATGSDSRYDNSNEDAVESTEENINKELECDVDENVGNGADTRTGSASLRDDDSAENIAETKSNRVTEPCETSSNSYRVSNQELEQKKPEDRSIDTMQEHSEKISGSDGVSNQESERNKLHDSTNDDTSVTAGNVERGVNSLVNLGSSTPPSPTSLEKEESSISNDDVPMEDIDSPEMPVLSRVSSISLIDECSEVTSGETGEATTLIHITEKMAKPDEVVSENHPSQESISLNSSNSLQSSQGFDISSQERKSRQSNDSEMEEIREEEENEVNNSDSSMEIENDIEDATKTTDVSDTRKETVKSIETSEDNDGNEFMETDDEERTLVIDEGISESEDNDKKNTLGINDSTKTDLDESRVSQEDKICVNDAIVSSKHHSDIIGVSEVDSRTLVKTSDKGLTTSDHRKVTKDSELSEDISDKCTSSRAEHPGNLTSSSSAKAESISISPSGEGTDEPDASSCVPSRVKSVTLCSKSSENVTDVSKHVSHSGNTSPVINSSCSSPSDAERPGDNSLSSAQKDSLTAKAIGKSAVPVQMPTKSKSLSGMDQLFKTGQSHTLYFRDGQGYKPIRIVIDDSEQSSAVIRRLLQASMAQLKSGLPSKNNATSLSSVGTSGGGTSVPVDSNCVGASKVVCNAAGHTVTSSEMATGIARGPRGSEAAAVGIAKERRDVLNRNTIGSSKQSHTVNHAEYSTEKPNVAHDNTVVDKLTVKDKIPVVAASSVSGSSEPKAFVSVSKTGLPVMQNSAVELVNKLMPLKKMESSIDTDLTKLSEKGTVHKEMIPFVNNRGSNAFEETLGTINTESIQKKQISGLQKDKTEGKDLFITSPYLKMKHSEVGKGSFSKKHIKAQNSSDERIDSLSFLEAHKRFKLADIPASKSMPNLHSVPTAKKVGSTNIGSFSKTPGFPPVKGPTSAYEGTITRVNPDIKSKLSKALQSPQRRLGQGRPVVDIDSRYPNIYGIAGNSGEIASGSVNSKISGETRQQL